MDKKLIERLRLQSPVAFSALSGILYQQDPIGINLGINPEEYDAETSAILPRLSECGSPVAVHKLVYEEFINAFGYDITGPYDRYEAIARRIWSELPGWLDCPRSRRLSMKTKESIAA